MDYKNTSVLSIAVCMRIPDNRLLLSPHPLLSPRQKSTVFGEGEGNRFVFRVKQGYCTFEQGTEVINVQQVR